MIPPLNSWILLFFQLLSFNDFQGSNKSTPNPINFNRFLFMKKEKGKEKLLKTQTMNEQTFV